MNLPRLSSEIRLELPGTYRLSLSNRDQNSGHLFYNRRLRVGDLTGATEIIDARRVVFLVLSRDGDEITPCRIYPSLWPHLPPAVKS